MDFRKIQLDDYSLVKSFTDFNDDKIGWDYNFSMIWVWDAPETAEICVSDNFLLIRNTYQGKTIYLPPFTRERAFVTAAVDAAAAACENDGIKLRINGLCAADAAMLDASKYNITTNRDDYDYIYLTRDLIELTGKKFHAKRNYITRFKSKYSYVFREYTKSDRGEVLKLFDFWQSNASHETLQFERNVLKRSLDFYFELGLKIGIIESDGKIIAFSVGKPENKNIAHIFLEKADINYDGIYPMINQLCAENFYADCKYINREEDMGIEGLRKSKLSYNPVFLVEKYNVRRL